MRQALRALIVGCLIAAGLVTPSSAAAPTYTNPVGDAAAENFADPTVIRGRDGYWYAYATGDPRFAGDYYRKLKIARSTDLVHWEYVGDVFTEETEPRYDPYGDDAVRMYWAPDIEYFGGRYLLYYSYVANLGSDTHWRAIGVATAPNPAGPWTDSGAYVTGPEQWEPRPGELAWRNVIDPEVVATPDGTRYLYYGSVLGGVRVVQLSDDGLTAIGERTQITPENRYEAAHLVHRDGYYYLFLSAIGGCCAGPVSAYPVHVARATDPRGPFLDRSGASMLGMHAGGTPVQTPNGNRWLSVGHNTIATDLAGQQWLVTHGIDRHDPYLQGTANARHLVLSRLDWIDGWPIANAGRGLLDGPERAPAMDAWIADSFESDSGAWQPTPGWELANEPAGGHLDNAVAGPRRVHWARTSLDGAARVRGTVRLGDGNRGAAGFALRGSDGRVDVVVDRAAEQLAIVTPGGRHTAPLPTSYQYDDWHELELQLDGQRLTATITDAGLDDPLAQVAADVPAAMTRLGALAINTTSSYDDITAAALFEPVTQRVPDPQVGDVQFVEDFAAPPGAGWGWVREPVGSVVDGQLKMPVQQANLVDSRANPDAASVLLRTPPSGAWTVETKVTVPFAESLPYGVPQAGLIAYGSDDDFVNLSYTSWIRPRFVSFGKEMGWDTQTIYADGRMGPTADTMWLRLAHTVDAATGEHHYRAATSLDGEQWVWHGVRTLAPDSAPRIGLAAYGLDVDSDLTASFDYFRIYASSPASLSEQ